jgi:hypothetical protein
LAAALRGGFGVKIGARNSLKSAGPWRVPVKASFMAVGAFFLVLGVGLIVLGLIFALLAVAGSVGLLGTYTNALTWGILISILGTLLAPVGGAVLAYGIGTKE